MRRPKHATDGGHLNTNSVERLEPGDLGDYTATDKKRMRVLGCGAREGAHVENTSVLASGESCLLRQMPQNQCSLSYIVDLNQCDLVGSAASLF